MTLKINDKFPTDHTIKYIPYSKANDSPVACGNPAQYDLAKELPGKKVIITAAPGAFTPTCTEQHIPAYLKHLKDFKSKGIDKIIVLTANDPFVLSAWAKALGYKDEENYVIFGTDPLGQISKEIGDDYVVDMSKAGFGLRTSRYVSVVDNGKIIYLANEDDAGSFKASDPNIVLAALK